MGVDYTFTTTDPTASNTKLSIGVGCKGDPEDINNTDSCQSRRELLSATKLPPLLNKFADEVRRFRCCMALTEEGNADECDAEGLAPKSGSGCTEYMNEVNFYSADIVAQYEAGSPIQRRLQGNSEAGRFLSVVPEPVEGEYEEPAAVNDKQARRLKETDSGMKTKMAGVPAQAQSLVLFLVNPLIVPAVIIAVMCAMYASAVGVAWWMDEFVAARFYDQTYWSLKFWMPIIAMFEAFIVPLLNALWGKHVASEMLYETLVNPLKVYPPNEYIKALAMTEASEARAWYCYLVSYSAAAAMSCAVSIYILTLTRPDVFKSSYGHFLAFLGISSAGFGLAGGTAGWGYWSELDLIDPNHKQYAYNWTIYSIAIGAFVSKTFCFLTFGLVSIIIGCFLPKIGPIVKYRLWWIKNMLPGSPGKWILYLRDLRFDCDFMDWLADEKNQGNNLLPGVLLVKFFTKTAPFNQVSTRSFPVNRDWRNSAVNAANKDNLFFDLEGETILLNCTDINDTVTIEIFIQDDFGRYQQKIGQTYFDPWTFQILQTCRNNYHTKGVAWNAKGIYNPLWDNDEVKKQLATQDRSSLWWSAGWPTYGGFSDDGFVEITKSGKSGYEQKLKEGSAGLGLRVFDAVDMSKAASGGGNAYNSFLSRQSPAMSTQGAMDTDAGQLSRQVQGHGRFHFLASHVGPLQELNTREHPADPPFRRGYLGDTPASKYSDDQIDWEWKCAVKIRGTQLFCGIPWMGPRKFGKWLIGKGI